MEEKQKAANEQTPVSPNVSINFVDYLLNPESKKVIIDDYTPEEWVLVLRGMIAKIKPQLRYFHLFEEIKVMVKRKWYREIACLENNSLINFSTEINEKTRVISIMGSYCGIKRSKLEEVRFKEDLLLTDSGKIVLVLFEFWKGFDLAKKVTFQEVNDDYLAEIVNRNLYCITELIFELQNLLKLGIKKREEQLDLLKNSLYFMNRLSNLITEFQFY